MFSTPPIITETGLTLLMRAAGGESITFTRFQAGKGIMADGETEKTMTALKDAVLTNIPITKAQDVTGGYIQLSATFNNQTDVSAAFRWTELGLMARDEQGIEYLYAYGYDNQNAETISPSDSSVIIEQNINVILAIGESENITAYVIPDATYASREAFDNHVGDTGNPHAVTYEQTGAAAARHTHGANEISMGVLPVARGGTGVSTLEALKAAVSMNYVMGWFVGDGATRKDITLGYKPSAVFVMRLPMLAESSGAAYCAYFREGENFYSGDYSPASAATEDASTLLNRGYGGAAVTDDGFAVGCGKSGRIYMNTKGKGYLYIAFK